MVDETSRAKRKLHSLQEEETRTQEQVKKIKLELDSATDLSSLQKTHDSLRAQLARAQQSKKNLLQLHHRHIEEVTKSNKILRNSKMVLQNRLRVSNTRIKS